MAWTDGDFKIFAAGLAIGGKYNHTHGTLPRVKASVVSGTYSSVFNVTLSCDLTAAIIMYSADGGTPTTVYAGEEIVIDAEGTHYIYAYAVYGQSLSPMAKYTYVIYVPRIVTSDTIYLFEVEDVIDIDFIIDTVVPLTDSISIYTLSDSVDITVT